MYNNPDNYRDLDLLEERRGSWMHVSSGGRFFPEDPRPQDIHVTDIANGLALDCRYAGQGRVDRFYSVAEHCYHIALYALNQGFDDSVCMAALFHDAAEAYLNDLPRAVKAAVGDGYAELEEGVQACILAKYGLTEVSLRWSATIKDWDRRIVPLEKAAIMRRPQPWAYDQFKPLEGVVIWCFDPPEAKARWIATYRQLCRNMGIIPEESEL